MLILNRIVEVLKEKSIKEKHIQVALPKLWKIKNSLNLLKESKEEIFVNPYVYLKEVIEECFLKYADDNKNYHQSIQQMNQIKNNKGSWIKDSIVYSALIRCCSSYDMDSSGFLEDRNSYGLKEGGTFIKMLWVLPSLKEMGIDVLYLLPVSLHSRYAKKGELGSPYSTKDFNSLDEDLSDPLVGDKISLEEQFLALVEACHILDIKVLIDFIPRTTAIDSVLLKDHPEWFYWIKTSELENYKPPFAPGIKKNTTAFPKYYAKLFSSFEVRNHILKFQHNPKESNPKLWNEIINKDLDLTTNIEENFGLSVSPAFSDCINDIQPIWSDVSYLRLFLDHPLYSSPYLDFSDDIAPYLLYDVAKASLNPGEIINSELWEFLSDVIVNYQKKYGIDGARIDMGHALPNALIEMIMNKARSIDPNFAFVAEELNPSRTKYAKKQKYNCAVGDSFIRLPRIRSGRFKSFVKETTKSSLPLFAAVETHDSPRAVTREGGKKFAVTATLFSFFMPAIIPFINCGQELLEKQPINTGLDCDSNSKYLLEKSDTYYGKLALFDRYQFHYSSSDRNFIKKISEAASIRRKYQKYLVDPKAVIHLKAKPQRFICALAYKMTSSFLLVLVNLDLRNSCDYQIQFPRLIINSKLNQIKQHFSNPQGKLVYQLNNSKEIQINLRAGEIKVLELF